MSAKKLDKAGVKAAPVEMSRKEREAMEAQRKAEAYRKKHAAGETDEAKSDLARLKAVRAKREADKAAREAREAAEKEEAAKAAAGGDDKKEKKEKKESKVELPVPTQKEVKSALLRIQDATDDDWQKSVGLKGLSGNKLAKMKYGDFMKIWDKFVEECSPKEHREYLG